MQLTNRQLFLQNLAQTSDAPMLLEIEKAEGVFMWDVNGKQYIDLISGISVSNLGHRNEKVVDAVKQQLDKYMHLMVYGEYIESPQTKLAKQITDLLPGKLNSCYFVNSGSEGIEGAMKLAKRYTGRSEIIAMRKSYHGSTQGAMSLNSDDYFTEKYRPLLPGIKFIEFNNYEALKNISAATACVVTEMIQAEAGVVIPETNYLKALRQQCDAHNVLLIADEVQTGFYRTGKLFAFEHFGIVPDVLVIGKALGGGMPLGAFIASKEIMDSFSHHPVLGHITTFGGHPVCCAAASANIEVLQSLNCEKEVERKSKLFVKLLQHEKIINISAFGLLIALEFENTEINKSIIKKCIENGVITDWFLFAENKMRIAPPLIIDDATIEKACQVILDAMH